MGCTITEDYNYLRFQHRPEIPKEPICLPEEAAKRLTWQKGVIMAVSVILAVVFSNYVNARSCSRQDAFVWMIAIAGYYLTVHIVKRITYAQVQNPLTYPKSHHYHGRLLNSHDPHFKLHLEYYKLYKSWTLPDHVIEAGRVDPPNTPSGAQQNISEEIIDVNDYES